MLAALLHALLELLLLLLLLELLLLLRIQSKFRLRASTLRTHKRHGTALRNNLKLDVDLLPRIHPHRYLLFREHVVIGNLAIANLQHVGTRAQGTKLNAPFVVRCGVNGITVAHDGDQHVRDHAGINQGVGT